MTSLINCTLLSRECYEEVPVDKTQLSDILNDSEREICFIANFVFLGTIICSCGIAGNVINIVIFLKQGFTNTVNISFFGLSISDLCCLIALIWVCICLNPLVARSGVPWIPEEFQYLTGAWPHIICGRITSYITAYITAERCLCILALLKLKLIITPARTTVTVCLIYMVNICTLIPEYATSYFDWTFIPNMNRTVLTMAFTKTRQNVIGIVFFLSSVTGMLSFLIVILFTVILAIKLKQTSQWRKGVASAGHQNDSVSNRDSRTVKMIVVIAIVLIVCYTPGTVITMTTFMVPDFMLGRRYQNMCFAMWSIGCVFQAVNSSINIFLYYGMSSKYRETFHQLFHKCKIRRTDLPKKLPLLDTYF